MDKRYQVFVSSTYADLKEERQHVIQALLEMDCIPSGMELFPAVDEEQWEFIKKIIDDCDYYILIIGGRYGSTTQEGISYTEMEYKYACDKGMKVTALLHKNPDLIPMGKSEIDPLLRERLRIFREKVAANRLVRFWERAEELPGLVSLSLSKTIKAYPAIGWVRANTVRHEELLADLHQLHEHNADLRIRLQRSEAENDFGKALLAFLYKSLEKDHSVALKLIDHAITLAPSKKEIARCLRNKGYTLGELRRDTEAIGIYSQLIDQFAIEIDEVIKREVAKSYINRGFLLVRNKRYAEAIRGYNRFIETYKNEHDPYFMELVSHAFVNKFESIIISNKKIKFTDFDQYYEIFRADKRMMMQLDMLKIIYNAQHQDQNDNLIKWKANYSEFRLKGWNFDAFKEWMSLLDDGEVKSRLGHYLSAFEKASDY